MPPISKIKAGPTAVPTLPSVNLQCRVVARTVVDPGHIRVHVEWFDPSGSILRADLIKEAEGLEHRAAQLRQEATIVPDQYDSVIPPHELATTQHIRDSDVLSRMATKREALAANLGLTLSTERAPKSASEAKR